MRHDATNASAEALDASIEALDSSLHERRIEVRELGLADLDLLMEWRARVLADVFSDACLPKEEQAALLRANRAYYQEQLASGGHRAFMAFVDGIPAACAGVCLQQELPSPDNPNGRCAYVMNVYALPQRRGLGLGTRVMHAALDAAAEEDVHKVYLETTQAGRPLYEKLGFVEMEGYLRLPPNETAHPCHANASEGIR